MWMGVPHDPAASAYDHLGTGLRRSDLDPNPISPLANWFTAAIDARRVLDARMAEMTERFGNKRIPLPPHWGGYRLKPDIIEFWQGRLNRLHDRFRYTRLGDDSWQIDRLAP